MKFKLLLLLGVFFIAISAIAQENKFPISGEYVIANDQIADQRNYNSITVSGDLFHFVKDGKIISTFKIKSKTEDTFFVEQYFDGNTDPKRDRRKMEIKVLKLESNSANLLVSTNYSKEYITFIPKK